MYYYSASNNAFYTDELKNEYEEAGSWPDDLKEISDADYYSIFDSTSTGMVISPDENGYPILIDPPPPSHAQLVSLAEEKKSRLMKMANDVITPLIDAIDLDMATEDERSSLLAWKRYRVLLMRVDTSPAPDIEWPDSPAVS